MAKRSQFQFRNGVPGGIFHHLQCSAGRMGILIKSLIPYGKLAVTTQTGSGASGGTNPAGLPTRGLRGRLVDGWGFRNRYGLLNATASGRIYPAVPRKCQQRA
jgi:hypothetical protein